LTSPAAFELSVDAFEFIYYSNGAYANAHR